MSMLAYLKHSVKVLQFSIICNSYHNFRHQTLILNNVSYLAHELGYSKTKVVKINFVLLTLLNNTNRPDQASRIQS